MISKREAACCGAGCWAEAKDAKTKHTADIKEFWKTILENVWGKVGLDIFIFTLLFDFYSADYTTAMLLENSSIDSTGASHFSGVRA